MFRYVVFDVKRTSYAIALTRTEPEASALCRRFKGQGMYPNLTPDYCPITEWEQDATCWT